MRKVRFSINMSLDGYCDHTIFNPDETVLDYFTDQLDDVDLLFFGRLMYQLMFPYWRDFARDLPGTVAENRFAKKFSAIDSVVVSRSLREVDGTIKIVRQDPAGALQRLKQQSGKTILLDSISLLPELVSAGLIDEFNVIIHPIVVGTGRHLLSDGSLQEKLDMKLVNTIPFKSGSIALHYMKK